MRRRRTAALVVVVVGGAAFFALVAQRKKSPDPATQAERLFAAGAHACAWMKDGSVRCWGSNRNGQLGVPSSSRDFDFRQRPERALAPDGAVDLALGGGLTCFRLKGGHVVCWGSFQLPGEDSYRDVPFDLSTIHEALEIGVSSSFGCARVASGGVQCWGNNTDGQLGVAEPRWAERPVDVPGIAGATALAVDGSHSCAVTTDGSLFCWGGNEDDGERDGGTHEKRRLPVRVSGLGPAVAVAVCDGSTCAILADGTAHCWGRNRAGQLGDGTRLDSIPVRIQGLAEVRELALGSQHACARLANGTLWCWGNFHERAEMVTGLFDVVEVRAGSEFTCARMRDATVQCWGSNWSGQLGDGSKEHRRAAPGPVKFSSLLALKGPPEPGAIRP